MCVCVCIKLTPFFFFFFFQTRIILVRRRDGQLFKTFLAEAFFYLHIVNSYEEDNHVIIDICCYKDATVLDCMYVDALMVIVCDETRTLFCEVQRSSRRAAQFVFLSASLC